MGSKFVRFGYKRPAGLSKLLSTCPENILRKNVLCQKFSLFFLNLDLMDSCWDHCFKNFSSVFGTAIYVLKGTVWEEEFFLPKLNRIYRYTFGNCAKSSRDMRRFFLDFFSEVYSSFREEQFHERNFVEVELFFIIFRSSAERLWTLQKLPKTVVNTLFYVSRGTFCRISWNENSLMKVFGLWPNFFAIMAKTLRPFFKTELRASGWRIAGKVFLISFKSFFERYRQFEIKFFV